MSVTEIGVDRAITEGSTARYTATLTDTAGLAIAGAAVTALTATLRDLDTMAIVNGRNAQNVLGLNGGTLSSAGVFTLTLTALDTAVGASTKTVQTRELTLKATYADGTLTHSVRFYIRNLADIS